MNHLGRTALMILMFAASDIFAQRCLAETQCPWLNAATASGFLGGDVQANVTALTSLGDTTCDFKRDKEFLLIAVHTMAIPAKEFATYITRCGGTAVPLKAIGNEAVQCIPNSNVSKGEEQIIGRVRDRAFVITLRADSTPPRTPTTTALSPEARNIAEQVAGALF